MGGGRAARPLRATLRQGSIDPSHLDGSPPCRSPSLLRDGVRVVRLNARGSGVLIRSPRRLLSQKITFVDRNRRYVSLEGRYGRLPLRIPAFAQVRFLEVKFPITNSSHIDDFCPRRVDFEKEGILNAATRKLFSRCVQVFAAGGRRARGREKAAPL